MKKLTEVEFDVLFRIQSDAKHCQHSEICLSKREESVAERLKAKGLIDRNLDGEWFVVHKGRIALDEYIKRGGFTRKAS